MIIDTHCHIDMLDCPEAYLAEKELSQDITLSMTNLPSHFALGIPFFEKLKYSRIALGFHPQLVDGHQSELELFKASVHQTSYIGEVGLDFSNTFIKSKEIQIHCFDNICQCIKGKNKIVSVHSRRAERDVLYTLKKYGIRNVIFHWYSGSLGLIDEIIAEGYYFSINEAMINSIHGKKIIDRIPSDRILTETDAPFNNLSNISAVLNYLGKKASLIETNFFELISKLR